MLQLKDLRVGRWEEPCIGLTQENSIENSVQDGLPYIQIPNGLCEPFLTYSKQPCVCLKVNMCFTYCMTSSFQNLLHPSLCHVTCDCVIWCDLLCDSVIFVSLTLLLVLKIENKSKMKMKMKIKWEREIKIKSTFSDLDTLCLKPGNSSWLENDVTPWSRMIKRIRVFERVLCWTVSRKGIEF